MGGTFDRDLKQALREVGWGFDRHAKGSHEIWRHPAHPRPIVVPQGIVSRHTANEVLKQAGLPKRF